MNEFGARERRKRSVKPESILRIQKIDLSDMLFRLLSRCHMIECWESRLTAGYETKSALCCHFHSYSIKPLRTRLVFCRYITIGLLNIPSVVRA